MSLHIAKTRFLSLRSTVSGRSTLLFGLTLFIAIFGVALFAPYLGTRDPAVVSIVNRLAAPSDQFWFGTDALGRDVYSRVLYGSRVSLIVGFSVALAVTVGGTALGLLAGFVRSADGIMMRIMDAVMSIPPMLLAIALVALLGPSVPNVIIAIALADLPRMARLVRSVVLTLRDLPFVEAAKLSGTSTSAIMLRHILPNALAPIAVQATYVFAAAVLIEAALSFIGAGTPSGTPSWGNIIAEARSLWQVKPHLVFVPAAFLSITVLSVNLIGDGVRDVLDPRNASGVQR
ncbi:ABC transporter permease [Aminobacter aminovorans]|uniref:Peptide ABC transporter permease n=1 Tax=Aminobacter aminovorans TaxID=83263 RepID=A0AAC8YW08_AMIAI|nr:ABC transporter permease [Aminobacter aminovorans]AMS45453.1 peptide ABC transporter permease [Aminobacter aminovorans]MBB3708660.1 peptide/nickel transport system permease protein [Aminobacter aminovorans]